MKSWLLDWFFIKISLFSSKLNKDAIILIFKVQGKTAGVYVHTLIWKLIPEFSFFAILNSIRRF